MQALLNSLAPEVAATIGHLAEIRPDKMQRVLRAIASDIDTMDAIASDITPAEEPVTDYITEVDMRCELFTKFRAMVQKFESSAWKDFANATMLAAFMIAPVHELQNFMQNCEATSRVDHHTEQFVTMLAPIAIRACPHNTSIFFFLLKLTYLSSRPQRQA